MAGLPEEIGPVRASDLADQLPVTTDPVAAFAAFGRLYARLLPSEVRTQDGVFYTPQPLAEQMLDWAQASGIDWTRHRVLDPACGAGAFLLPAVRRKCAGLKQAAPQIALRNLRARIRGFELDPFSAWLCQAGLEAVVAAELGELGAPLALPGEPLVLAGDALMRHQPTEAFDLVIGNPPFGRVTLEPQLRSVYARSLHGHANLYGLFTDLAVRWTAPGGLIAWLSPTSFLAGRYFSGLRGLLAQEAPPERIGFVEARRGVFEGVLQETAICLLRRTDDCTGQTMAGHPVEADVRSVAFQTGGAVVEAPLGRARIAAGADPRESGQPWLIPRAPAQARALAGLQQLPARLADWGYGVSTGPLVWNRHKPQMRTGRQPDCLPVIWAESVRPGGTFDWRFERATHSPWIEGTGRQPWLHLSQPCVLVQRTTAKEQPRRLITAVLPQSFIDRHGTVVVENHLNMVLPLSAQPPVSLGAVQAWLSSEPADLLFRCLSGSVAVSAYELEALPLPSVGALERLEALVAGGADQPLIEAECWRLAGVPPR
jgi:adenine-specific DNA-methyltransferase